MIALGSDHSGYELKMEIIKYLEENNLEYIDYGSKQVESSDYPVFAKRVGRAIQKKECNRGIIICGTGIGISIAANKMDGIRAALCHDCFSARSTREHNDANVLALGARVVGAGLALEIVDIFLATEYSNAERHNKRINMLEDGELE